MRMAIFVSLLMVCSAMAGGKSKGVKIGKGLRAITDRKVDLGKLPRGTVKYFSFEIKNESKQEETVTFCTSAPELLYKDSSVTIKSGESYTFKGKLSTGTLEGKGFSGFFAFKTDKKGNNPDLIGIQASIEETYVGAGKWIVLKKKGDGTGRFEGSVTLKKSDAKMPDLKAVETTVKGVDAKLEKGEGGWTVTIGVNETVIDAGPIGYLNLIPADHDTIEKIRIPLVPAKGLTLVPNEVVYKKCLFGPQRPRFRLVSGEAVDFKLDITGMAKVPDGFMSYGATKEEKGVYLLCIETSGDKLKKDAYEASMKTYFPGFKKVTIPIKVVK